jgi:hypothetical protein
MLETHATHAPSAGVAAIAAAKPHFLPLPLESAQRQPSRHTNYHLPILDGIPVGVNFFWHIEPTILVSVALERDRCRKL